MKVVNVNYVSNLFLFKFKEKSKYAILKKLILKLIKTENYFYFLRYFFCCLLVFLF